MAMKTPLISEIAPETYAINEFGLAAMYLLVGQEKALLIDTGCGACDLKTVVAGLTEKPCMVAITHGHMDHAGGMGQFETVYLHEKDWEMAKQIDVEELRNYAQMFGEAGSFQIYDFSPKDIQRIKTMPQFLPMRDGDVFDLGGRVVEVHEIAGHTPGGVAFLDVDNRIIFSGDCCNINLLTPWCSVETTLKNLRKFKALSNRFDQNFNGHAGFMGNPACLSQPRSVPDDLIHICECILRHEDKPEPYNFLGHQLTQMKYGHAKLSYDPNRITEN